MMGISHFHSPNDARFSDFSGQLILWVAVELTPGAAVDERIHDGFTSTVTWLKPGDLLGIQLEFFQGLRSNCIKFSSLGRRFVHFFLSSTGQIRCYFREVQGNIFGIYHGFIFQSLHTWTVWFPNFLSFLDVQSFSSHLSVSQNGGMRYTLSIFAIEWERMEPRFLGVSHHFSRNPFMNPHS